MNTDLIVSRINPTSYYSTPQAGKLVDLTRHGIFKAIQRGKLRARKIGKNYIIIGTDLIEFVQGDSYKQPGVKRNA